MEKVLTESGDQVVINTVSEDATLDEVTAYACEHLDRWAQRDIIWDLTRFSFDGVTPARLRELIAQTEHTTEKRKGLLTALVVRSDLGYGLMRMFSMLAEGRYQSPVAVFRSLDEAKLWLQSPASRQPPSRPISGLWQSASRQGC